LGQKDWDPDEDGNFSGDELMAFIHKNLKFMIDFASAGLIILAYVAGYGRGIEWHRVELTVWSMVSVLLWSNLLNIIMPVKFFGILVIIIYKMLIGDFFKFVVIYFIMIGGFSQAVFCLFQMPDFPEKMQMMDVYPGNAILRLIMMSLGDVDQQALINETASPDITTWVYLCWLMLSTVLLINLLIAMMGQTYDSDMEDTHKTWIFPFAHLVLTYEGQLSNADKVRFRSGTPGTTEMGHDNNMENEPFFQIKIEGDKEQAAKDEQIRAQKKAHRLCLEELSSFEGGLDALTEGIDQLSRAMGLAEHIQQEESGNKASAFLPPVSPRVVDEEVERMNMLEAAQESPVRTLRWGAAKAGLSRLKV